MSPFSTNSPYVFMTLYLAWQREIFTFMLNIKKLFWIEFPGKFYAYCYKCKKKIGNRFRFLNTPIQETRPLWHISVALIFHCSGINVTTGLVRSLPTPRKSIRLEGIMRRTLAVGMRVSQFPLWVVRRRFFCIVVKSLHTVRLPQHADKTFDERGFYFFF